MLNNRFGRRLITIPVVAIGAVVSVVLLPLTLVIAALVDRGQPWRRIRLVALVTAGLVIEVVGLITALIAWVVTGFGLGTKTRFSRRLHAAIMGRYSAALLGLLTTVLGTRVEWRDAADVTGPVIVLARHTSFFDALLPSVLLSRRNRLAAHHVLAGGLRFSPCIDLVGHRIATQFIDRRPGQADLAAITRLAQHVDETSAAVIFPEGTFRTEQRHARAVKRLRRRDGETADRAQQLRHVLPPQARGTSALLAGAPDADIVVCVNTGFEPFITIGEIAASMVAERPIVIETWTIPRSEVPTTAEAQSAWLFDLFEQIDHWVENEHQAAAIPT